MKAEKPISIGNERVGMAWQDRGLCRRSIAVDFLSMYTNVTLIIMPLNDGHGNDVTVSSKS